MPNKPLNQANSLTRKPWSNVLCIILQNVRFTRRGYNRRRNVVISNFIPSDSLGLRVHNNASRVRSSVFLLFTSCYRWKWWKNKNNQILYSPVKYIWKSNIIKRLRRRITAQQSASPTYPFDYIDTTAQSSCFPINNKTFFTFTQKLNSWNTCRTL